MRLQLITDSDFRVLEQFTNPTDRTIETVGTKELRIFEVNWSTPGLGIYEWDSGDEQFKIIAPTDDEGSMTHYQAGGVNTGVWISPEIKVSAFTAGLTYVFQFFNVDNTVYQTYEILYKGEALWADARKIAGLSVSSLDDFKADVSGLSTFDSTSEAVNVGKVSGSAVAGVDDFKANVSGLSTFNNITDAVNIDRLKGDTSVVNNIYLMYSGAVTPGSITDGSPTANSFKDGTKSAISGFYEGSILTFTSGDLKGLSRRIQTYANYIFTVEPAFPAIASVGDEFSILGRID